MVRRGLSVGHEGVSFGLSLGIKSKNVGEPGERRECSLGTRDVEECGCIRTWCMQHSIHVVEVSY